MATRIHSSTDTLGKLVNVYDGIKMALLRKGRIPTPTSETGEKPDSQKLEEVAKKAHEILFKTDTVFPFTLFPDTVTVEREKVTIAKRHFFRIATITNIPVRDLLNVESDVGPFFGSVHISSRFFEKKALSVNFLWRDDALQLQRLLQGYIIAHEREIDCISVDKKELIGLLNTLGVGDTA